MIVILSNMRPSILSAMRIIFGMGAAAVTIAVVVGLTVEWGIVSGVLRNAQWFDMVLVVEAAGLALVAALLAGAIGRPKVP
jgi:hypothetical protein